MSQVVEERPAAEALLARIDRHARLRVYIGAAPGVGKTYQMLEDAQNLRHQGHDVVIGFVETYGRAGTEAQIKDLETIPRKKIEYRNVLLEEMDVEAVIARKPEIALVDELAHSNVPGSTNKKRYEDVLDLLEAGISVFTAVNIQHLETLNDAVARSSGIRVRETVPDSFLKRADEVVNVDVTVDELRTRLKQGHIYKPEKVEQALANFFRKGNLSTLRELALRAVAEEVGSKAAQYRSREGLEPASIPEKVMVCMSSNESAKKLLRAGSRIAGRLGVVWFAVYVETPEEAPSRISAEDARQLEENFAFGREMGATIVRLKAKRVSDGIVEFARREGISHVIFGQSARSRWDILLHGSVLNRFLAEVKDAAVQVIPTKKAGRTRGIRLDREPRVSESKIED
jgi:two-component system sensor histidine kinase KdpD